MRALTLSLLAALVLASCGSDEFSPAWLIQYFRVLGVPTSPPDVAPGETVHFALLTGDRPGPARPVTAAWRICAPVGRPADGVPLCPEGTATQLGTEASSTLPATAPLGTRLVAIGYACAGGTLSLNPATSAPSCDGGEGAAFLRTVRARTAYPNHNPTIARVLLDGVELTADASPTLHACTDDVSNCPWHSVAFEFGAAPRDTVSVPQPDGSTTERPESLVSQFLVDGGGLDGTFRSDGDENAERGHANRFRARGLAGAPRDVALWILVRDEQGGFTSVTRTLHTVP